MLEAITAAMIYDGSSAHSGKVVLVENGRIQAITEQVPQNARIRDLGAHHLAPAMIDLQLNGGYQYYFSKELNETALEDMTNASLETGAGYFLPTLISAPPEAIIRAIELVKAFMKKEPAVLGLHLEGPFINVEKRGAHPAAIIRKPTDEELQQIIAAGKEVIKVITIAPECFTESQLQMLLDSGIHVSLGHSTVNYEQAKHYFSRGIRMVTHLYNAMNQMGHRECGLVGAVFDHPQVYAPLILDGGHCHYAAARIAYRQKGEKLVLISDAAFLGRKKQSFEWEHLNIRMVDGFYRDENDNLGGAAISMADAFRAAVNYLELPLTEAVAMTSSRVATSIGMAEEVGQLKEGYPARFTVFDQKLQSFRTLIV
ncbi:N-acetylglucosamine-6-phosphate deacetylase [Niabella terrae]